MLDRFPSAGAGPSLSYEHADAETLDELHEDARSCTRCDLYRNATHLVFGEGPARADIVLVGEQPGDKEDVAGRPFVGPAGRLLDECLEEAGVDRDRCYVTNAVKHFKYQMRGKKRLHARPNAGEVQRCAWWLGAELELLKPKLVVALGATAVSSLLGSKVRVMRDRGQILHPSGKLDVLVTIHPSALLRIREADEREKNKLTFIRDLKKIRSFLRH
ncbi:MULTISPECIES: UdgX family uracil-DNA binding protein [unclassified Rhizobium]|uniref:UdgX family uracil-DNA binding protein n=1 Tax=Rhizobium TaxID=379 RepID=UPI00084C430C|nr:MULTISPECIES: UdgX family uracil-DNA binding protein [unclassified Rhizobium]OEC95416.1 uracil-DNA glycosylase [Rhizobium sp. YK2]QYA15030.1 UdgX family uracil-DNA binding protein [Rhizobium sp. AB2/73]UEQ84105.1 UdgX family uracil-DNA binding protein [Rhizobium sp. AB2/73]